MTEERPHQINKQNAGLTFFSGPVVAVNTCNMILSAVRNTSVAKKSNSFSCIIFSVCDLAEKKNVKFFENQTTHNLYNVQT